MNILIVNTSFFALSETFVFNQVKGIHEAHSVYLMAEKFQNEQVFPLEGIHKKEQISFRPNGLLSRAFHFLERKLASNDYLLPRASRNHLKQFIVQHNIDLVHVHFGNNALRLKAVLSELEIPMLVSFHGYDASRLTKNKSYSKHLKELFNQSFSTIVCAENMFKNLQRFGLDKSKTSIIHYGVDHHKITAIPRTRTDAKIRLIHAGRIAAKKGVPDLLRVFLEIKSEGKFKDLELVLIGEGNELPTIENLLSTSQFSEDVHLLGAMPHSALLKELKQADIFVLNSRIDPSGDSEGFPNGILEAMAAGVPVVSTIHAGIPEVVIDGETGLLVPEKDQEALKLALLKLIKEPELRTKLAKQALLKVQGDFSLATMKQKLQALIEAKGI